MGDLKWHKRDHRAALTGMMELTLEERGAYNTILDLIYCHDGALLDDERFIAGWLRVDVRRWRRIRNTLLAAGKLYQCGPNLRNERADREVDAAQHRVRSAADAGRVSAAKRLGVFNHINGLGSTVVQRPFQLPTSRKKY